MKQKLLCLILLLVFCIPIEAPVSAEKLTKPIISVTTGVRKAKITVKNRVKNCKYEIMIKKGETNSWEKLTLTKKRTYKAKRLSPRVYYSFKVRAVLSDDKKSVYSDVKTRLTKGYVKYIPGPSTVYITASGAKYHRKGCSRIRSKGISIKRWKAKALCYSPCSTCKPG